ncbi:MAG: hypothetical protein ACOX4B_03705 [Bacillota bacterium]
MDKDEGRSRAITLNGRRDPRPSRTESGSLTPGKDADLVIYEGDPMEINGKVVDGHHRRQDRVQEVRVSSWALSQARSRAQVRF